jgi:tRNA threonylcarbamoyladenosine biosynthesis protein TsaB
MGLILCIETATRICSVALGRNGKIISLRESSGEYSHSKQITLFVREVTQEAGIVLRDLDAVAVSKGPGSFTGLRIGVSTAKGLCYALDKPLISAGTLQCMALGMAQMISPEISKNQNILFCPMIDARRMEVYAALYSKENTEVLPPVAEIITGSSFSEYLSKHIIVFAGDGAEKCQGVFEGNANAVFPDIQLPSATYMIPLAETALMSKKFEDVGYFEPYYLKDFVAGKPNVKGLR